MRDAWKLIVLMLASSVGLSRLGGDSPPPRPVEPPRSKKKPKAPVEDTSKLEKLINKMARGPKTERDRLLEELAKFYKDAGPPARPDAGDAEFHDWFDRLSGGGAAWRVSDTHKDFRSIFARIVDRLDLDTDALTRDQFLRYAREYLAPGKSPVWSQKPPKDPLAGAGKLFKKLDDDRDGILSGDELPAELRADLQRWDGDRDGRIDPQEYASYFEGRLRELARERGVVLPDGKPAEEAARKVDDEGRPKVYRPGRMPAGLPNWFTELDEHPDGQIGLYEWKAAGRPAAEFLRFDLNQDGFITVEEWQRVERAGTKASHGPPVGIQPRVQ